MIIIQALSGGRSIGSLVVCRGSSRDRVGLQVGLEAIIVLHRIRSRGLERGLRRANRRGRGEVEVEVGWTGLAFN